MSYTKTEERDRGEWISCPECGCENIGVSTSGDMSPTINLWCRECDATDHYYL